MEGRQPTRRHQPPLRPSQASLPPVQPIHNYTGPSCTRPSKTTSPSILVHHHHHHHHRRCSPGHRRRPPIESSVPNAIKLFPRSISINTLKYVPVVHQPGCPLCSPTNESPTLHPVKGEDPNQDCRRWIPTHQKNHRTPTSFFATTKESP